VIDRMKPALQGNNDVVGMAPASFTAYQEYDQIAANQAILEAKAWRWARAHG
jgi:hypothetical protein